MRRICKHCRAKFQPKRIDAQFCCNLCRQAAHRIRKIDISAEQARKSAEQARKDADAHFAIQAMENYLAFSPLAALWGEWMPSWHAPGVHLFTMKGAILAVEDRPGSILLAKSVVEWPGYQLRTMREIEGDTKHPDILKFLPPPDCRSMYCPSWRLFDGPPRKASMFIGPSVPHPKATPLRAGWHFEDRYQPDDDDGQHLDGAERAELLAGGGYQIE
jgi:hypothetical protein